MRYRTRRRPGAKRRRAWGETSGAEQDPRTGRKGKPCRQIRATPRVPVKNSCGTGGLARGALPRTGETPVPQEKKNPPARHSPARCSPFLQTPRTVSRRATRGRRVAPQWASPRTTAEVSFGSPIAPTSRGCGGFPGTCGPAGQYRQPGDGGPAGDPVIRLGSRIAGRGAEPEPPPGGPGRDDGVLDAHLRATRRPRVARRRHGPRRIWRKGTPGR